MSIRVIVAFSIFMLFVSGHLQAEDLKQIIFEEQRIEGKIRRPQLVLIKAEQRPEFSPMVLQSIGKNSNLIRNSDEKIIDNSPYKGPFKFQGTQISNYVP